MDITISRVLSTKKSCYYKPGSELVLRIFNNIKEPHMNTKVLTTLEYNKIIDLLTEKADSEPGKKL